MDLVYVFKNHPIITIIINYNYNYYTYVTVS